MRHRDLHRWKQAYLVWSCHQNCMLSHWKSEFTEHYWFCRVSLPPVWWRLKLREERDKGKIYMNQVKLVDLYDQGFATKAHLTKHKSRMHSRKQEECHYCQQKFKTVQILQQHFEDSHQIRDCEECDFMTTSNTDFQKHMTSTHPQASGQFWSMWNGVREWSLSKRTQRAYPCLISKLRSLVWIKHNKEKQSWD